MATLFGKATDKATDEEHEAALLEVGAAKLAHETAVAAHQASVQAVGFGARQTLREVNATFDAWCRASFAYAKLIARDPFAGLPAAPEDDRL